LIEQGWGCNTDGLSSSEAGKIKSLINGRCSQNFTGFSWNGADDEFDVCKCAQGSYMGPKNIPLCGQDGKCA
jgi:hypothetical protein